MSGVLLCDDEGCLGRWGKQGGSCDELIADEVCNKFIRTNIFDSVGG